MQYVIENAAYIENGQKEKLSFMIKDNEFRYIGPNISYHNVMKMEASTFLITPSYIFFAPDLPEFPYEQFKAKFLNEYVLKGCGTIITNFTINRISEFDQALRRKRMSLLNSPVDFLLGIQINAKLITTDLIRKCKREKIPIIFVEITKMKELYSIPWGWIRDISFPLNPIFIPIFTSELKLFSEKMLLQKWTTLLEDEKIVHLPSPLQKNKPLSIDIIKKIGLYPKKGILKVGGELSYNLFFMKKDDEQRRGYPYGVDLYPDVSVHKGKYVSINQVPIFRSGTGEELIIHKTAIFV